LIVLDSVAGAIRAEAEVGMDRRSRSCLIRRVGYELSAAARVFDAPVVVINQVGTQGPMSRSRVFQRVSTIFCVFSKINGVMKLFLKIAVAPKPPFFFKFWQKYFQNCNIGPNSRSLKTASFPTTYFSFQVSAYFGKAQVTNVLLSRYKSFVYFLYSGHEISCQHL
jgi:hypothetical protein